ncbi:fluoroquinolone resistance protein [Staphylococcus gallinarum]|uniref:Fluoroquinolone resistance protein n=1 Tax=Staphylococcus gallinarum TaxID=1293 RepID=A0A380FCJ5_STAGA|nr:fluoroquinolone resistance protein [Staphylococcus gallinarum]
MNKQFVILYFNIFLVFLGIGLIVPVLPVYLKDLGLNGSDLGVLVAAFALAQMVISPFGGTLADKLGKKLIICIGLALFAISEFLFAVSHSFSLLIISRILGGFSAGMVMPGVNRYDCRHFTRKRQSQKILAICLQLLTLALF